MGSKTKRSKWFGMPHEEKMEDKQFERTFQRRSNFTKFFERLFFRKKKHHPQIANREQENARRRKNLT